MRCTLLHGFAGDPSAWDAVIAAWGAHVAPVAVALPGHGGGDVRGGWEANLDALGVHEVIVGYSLGARLALGLLARGACTRAVLVSVNPGLTSDAERTARRAADAEWAHLLRTQGIAAFVDAWQAQPLFASQTGHAELTARRARRMQHDPEQLARALEHMGLAAMPDYRAQLAAAADRITLVVGAGDPKFVALAHSTGRPVVAIPHSGHDPTLEQPGELARVIAGALADQAPA